jgi:hypothetical protein
MYAWMIDKDYIDSEGAKGEPVQVFGPRTATEEQMARLQKGEGRAFRIYDDDGIRYYSGRIVDSDRGSETDFGPLDDYGTPNAGATEIRYFDKGKWQTL